MVDWRTVPKIDAHIHLLPDDVIAANSGCGDPFVDYGSVDDYLTIMEKYAIERAFVMPFNDPCMLSMDFTISSVHRNLKEMIHKAPGKLYCFADVDIRNAIGKTMAELECTMGETGYVGIKFHPANTGYPADGEYYASVFRFAKERGLPVEIHSYPREHLTDDVSSPARIKRLMEKYPEVTVSVSHLGGFQYEELIGINGFFNISAILPDLVNRYGIEETNKILRRIGVEKLVFATDYPDSRCLKPTEIYDTYFDILNQMDFSLEDAEKICKFNALKLIGK